MRLIVQRLVLAVAFAVAALMFIPAPAQAGGRWIEICTYIELTDDVFVIDDCHMVYLPIPEPSDPWPPDCWNCILAFDIWDDKIDPGLVFEFNQYFNKGFGLLAESRLTEDPKLADQMRKSSVEYFLAAAKALGQYTVALDAVGWANPDTGEIHHDSGTQPLLETFGKELAAGTTLFQGALWEQQPGASVDAALAHYDAALDALDKTAVG
ncbi:hypothetical protein K3N28_02005 [Glycomyces sp. TRM65418]|uniref:hypothetical protein n=1 Tax=Glycomyces sp. TRM65418 TaxID=2867006 RepID=UPI001CE5FE00|nr:hypothetical protein [Glycomyces sp. TRM65418]MCC3761847.1 hypothetical protein [Glycomyces sp. TRM65418]QZD55929.1 hypothetical protein K3N28_01995 [Glycomyces sp. TRM65418]